MDYMRRLLNAILETNQNIRAMGSRDDVTIVAPEDDTPNGDGTSPYVVSDGKDQFEVDRSVMDPELEKLDRMQPQQRGPAVDAVVKRLTTAGQTATGGKGFTAPSPAASKPSAL